MILDGLAVYRLTRLVTRDRITRGARDRVALLADEDRLPEVAADFVRCPWCVAVWASLVVLVVRRWSWGRWAVRLLALSCVAAVVSDAYPPDRIEWPDGTTEPWPHAAPSVPWWDDALS